MQRPTRKWPFGCSHNHVISTQPHTLWVIEPNGTPHRNIKRSLYIRSFVRNTSTSCQCWSLHRLRGWLGVFARISFEDRVAHAPVSAWQRSTSCLSVCRILSRGRRFVPRSSAVYVILWEAIVHMHRGLGSINDRLSCVFRVCSAGLWIRKITKFWIRILTHFSRPSHL